MQTVCASTGSIYTIRGLRCHSHPSQILWHRTIIYIASNPFNPLHSNLLISQEKDMILDKSVSPPAWPYPWFNMNFRTSPSSRNSITFTKSGFMTCLRIHDAQFELFQHFRSIFFILPFTDLGSISKFFDSISKLYETLLTQFQHHSTLAGRVLALFSSSARC